MLDGIRKASKNWLGRAVLMVIMGILVLSFAVWGIGDMLRVTGSNSVARVGNTDISTEQMRVAYNSSLEDVSQRLRRRLTNDEARAFGLDKQVLSRLISEAAMDQKVKSLGLNLSDADVVRQVMAEPSLRGANGQFDRAKFADVLRNSNMTEAMFFAEQKRAMLRRQLSTAIAGDLVPPQALVEAAYRYASEQRVVQYFVLDPSKAGTIAVPDEATLKAYYDANKADFRAPEYRKVNLLAALPRALGIDLTVTDADVRSVYNRLIAAGQLGAPPKRQVLQILYPTEPEAAAAAAKLKSGSTFENLLEERKLSTTEADLGMLAQSAFADPGVGAAAFALEQDAVSAPIKTAFGYALIKLVNSEAGTLASFEDSKAGLTAQAQTEKLRSDPKLQARMDEIQKKIDEAKIAGKSLAEAAPTVGLPLVTIEAIDNTGKDKNGAPVTIPGGEDTVKAIFQSDIGLDNEAVRIRDGGYVWFDIAGTEPSRDRSYDEIKPQLLVRWQAEQADKALLALANEDVKKLDAGASIADLAKAAGVEVKSATINRNQGGEIGATGAAQAFAIPVGKSATASLGNGSRVVLKVAESKLAPLEAGSGVALQLSRQIGAQVSEDLITEYVQKLQSDLGTRIDQRGLQQAVGGGSGS